MDARKQILVFDKTYTGDQTSDPDVKFPHIDLLGLKPPFLLVVLTSNGGASAPVTPSIAVQVQETDPLKQATYGNVSGWVNTAITSTGNQFAKKEQTVSVSRYVRAVCTVSFVTPNDGTRVQAWIIGTRE